MEKKTYSEKLKDPRWQKKRLEVLSRDEWMCQLCQDNESTLHVHHFSYNPFVEPWDYDLNNFITLCESCHNYETTRRSCVETMLLEMIKIRGFLSDDVEEIYRGFQKLKIQYAPEYTASVIKFALSDGWVEVLELFENDVQERIERRAKGNV